jgi:tetratricopeptide (TPR) repeat protein
MQDNPEGSIQVWFEEAVRHHGAGRLADAHRLYRRILETDPQHADALHLFGVLALQSGHAAVAADLIRKAIALDPAAAAYHVNLGSALATQGQLEEAIASHRHALALDPNSSEAYCNLAQALWHSGRPAEASAAYEQALAILPNSPQALANLGNVLWQQGRTAEAIARCREALAIEPNFPHALATLGNALRDEGELEEAIASFRRALSLKPDFAEVWSNLGAALRDQGNLEEAITCCKRALVLKPSYTQALVNLGAVLRDQGNLQEALACYRQALSTDPDSPQALANLAQGLQDEGNIADAMACCYRALALDRACDSAYNCLGISLMNLGRLEAAKEHFEAALALEPRKVEYLFNFADINRFAAGDRHLRAMEDLAADADSLSPQESIALHFALGKAHGDLGNHEQSFRHLLQGNRLKREELVYDEAPELQLFERVRRVFTPELIERHRGVGERSPLPVFIIGMPRSGTTLLEQILAAHPLVFGAGELTELDNALSSVGPPPGAPAQLPERIATFTGAQIRQIGVRYLENLRVRGPWAERISDKLPENFRLAGLIHIALPAARIVHIRRDPVDTCLSCFSKLFTEGHAYSYDLAELGRYCKAYERLMDHWRSVLPPGAMLEIRYEELVANVEQEARRLLDYCGLAWDPACLAFHKGGRPVLTASAGGVRQPIYGSSVGRSNPYRAMLQPLTEALSARI